MIEFHYYSLNKIMTEKESFDYLNLALRRIINIYIKNVYIYKKSFLNEMNFFFYKREHMLEIYSVLSKIYNIKIEKNTLTFIF